MHIPDAKSLFYTRDSLSSISKPSRLVQSIINFKHIDLQIDRKKTDSHLRASVYFYTCAVKNAINLLQTGGITDTRNNMIYADNQRK